MSEPTFFQRHRDPLVFAVIAALVLVIYRQVTGFDFINFDDNQYVYDNPAVRAGLTKASAAWALTAFHSANWHPLTWLSHMLDVSLFGLNPGGHHAVNVLFHLINSLLAFAVFHRLTGSAFKSALVAALFAVHPAHVESVAWVAERKDVLSTLFWLLTMFAYARWNEEGSKPTSPYYLATILLFALGLMAKPMLVTLPFVLLLCDFWPLKRLKFTDLKCIGLLIAEKIPLFVLSAASSFITLRAQRAFGAVETLSALPLTARLENVAVAYAKYVITLFFPVRLAVWYPFDQQSNMVSAVIAVIFLVGVTVFCLSQLRTRGYLLFGWLWFVGTLVPVIGLVQVGSQSMADRYTYVPYFGLFVMLVWGLADALPQSPLGRRFGLIFASCAVLALSVVAHRQTSYWRNGETLYRHSLAVTRDNYLVSLNLCTLLVEAERLDEAEPVCEDAVRINPQFYEVQNTYGIFLLKRGRAAEAEDALKTALRLRPDYDLTLANLATVQIVRGKPEEAEVTLERAVRVTGESVPRSFWLNHLRTLAIAWIERGNYQKAAENWQRVILIEPNDAVAHGRLAEALLKIGQRDAARTAIETAVRLDPNAAPAYNVYGEVMEAFGDRAQAISLYQKATELKPDFTAARENLRRLKGEK